MAQSKAPPFTLYEYRPSPFCVAVRIALNEIGTEFTPREVDLKKPRTAAFLKRSPFGGLPALVEHRPGGELAIFEITAILSFLSERFPESSLGFPDMQSRAEGGCWLSFINTGLVASVWSLLLERCVYQDEEKSEMVERRAMQNLEQQLGVLDKHLARRAFLSGAYSVADTLATPILDLFEMVEIDMGAYPRVRSWRDRLRDRPSYKGVWPYDEDIKS